MANHIITQAVEAGASFWPTGPGEWCVTDILGKTIVEGCESMSEAARIFLERKRKQQLH